MAWTTASQTVLPLLASVPPLLCFGRTLALSSSRPLACRTARAAVQGLLSRHHKGYIPHRGRWQHVYERQGTGVHQPDRPRIEGLPVTYVPVQA